MQKNPPPPPVQGNGSNLHGKMLLGTLLRQEENIYRMVEWRLGIAGDTAVM